MNIGIVVCTNGYGHIRRQSIVARELISKGNNVTIYFPRASLEQISPDLVDCCCDFNTRTASSDWIKGEAQSWINTIGSLSEFDVVISDNLLDVLSLRPDAIISGSFFWHKTLDLAETVTEHQESLLSECKPTIVSNRYFSPPYIKSTKNFRPIGFIKDKRSNQRGNKTTRGKTALLSIGMGRSESEILMQSYVTDVLTEQSQNFQKFEKIYIERRIYKESLPDNFVRARFDEKMFNDLDVVIGRPGIGLVSECVTRNIDYVSILEESNAEMVFNNGVLSREFNIDVAKDFEEGLELAFERCSRQSAFNKVNSAGLNEFVSVVEDDYEFHSKS